MSENTDLVRMMLEAWNRRDMATVGRHIHPDFEWVEHEYGLTESPVVRGTAAVEQITATLEEGIDDYRAEVVNVVDISDSQVVAVTRESGQGSASGAPFSTEFGYVLTLRDGRIARVEAYRDPREAFTAVGYTDPSGA